LSAEYVVDASAGVKLFVEEENSDKARALFADPDAVLHVPDLFFIECTNVLWKKVRREEYDFEDALANVGDLAGLDLKVTSTAELAGDAFLIAFTWDVSAYDACYAGLALSLGLPLVTADARLAEKLTAKGFPVVLLEKLAG